MIEIMGESTGDVLGVRAKGTLTRSDYDDVLAPQIGALLNQVPTLRVLFLIDETFEGWTVDAAWANTVFDLKHRRDFDKIAMVGAPTWEEWCVRAPAALLMKGELRTFRRPDLERAWAWLRQ